MSDLKRVCEMKPILFNTEMVKAILDGRKTQTRRVVNKEYLGLADIEDNNIYVPNEDGGYINILRTSWSKYKVGDILYVRETFAENFGIQKRVVYKAEFNNDAPLSIKWKPSIHMPKKYARIFLKVTNVRVEKLQDITYDDCLREGFLNNQLNPTTTFPTKLKNTKIINYIMVMEQWWANLWNSTAKYGYKWEDNPYVFVYEFERVEV
ncbi:hypothetical protein N5912_07585 [Arcobacter lacus]|uniref:hypothetical protein n=1 Tax=Arcobacter lacus TaxID=1912876 RepID=UPI0021BABD2F|nr:hypothetical protein [Arcobacter lacus]MCT7911687.1 hypothetical protein [Arcobacter lacus]